MIDGVHDYRNEYVIGRAELLALANQLQRTLRPVRCRSPPPSRLVTVTLPQLPNPAQTPSPPATTMESKLSVRSLSSLHRCSPLAPGKPSRSSTSKTSSQKPASPSPERRTNRTSLQRSLLLPTRSTSTTRTTVLRPHRPRRTRLLRQRVQQQSPNQCVFRCRHCPTFAQRARRDASPPQSPKAYVGASFADILAHIHFFRAHL